MDEEKMQSKVASSDDMSGSQHSSESETISSPTAKPSHTDLSDDEVHAVTALTPPPPAAVDGGLRAWLQVVGSFLAFSNLWGMTFAFGSFQNYYELTYIPSKTASDISWIGTTSTFLLIFVGVISGPLFDRGHFRTMLLAGAFIETLGVFMVSLCKTYWQLYLAQGIFMGLGNGLLYVPGLALVGRSFSKHRAIAMAITTCGAPTGGVIYTLIFEQLITRTSFHATVRIMGYVMLSSYCIAFPLLLWGARNLGNLSASSTRRLVDLSAFRDLPFCIYTASNFFLFLGYMIPFIYLASFAQNSLHLSRTDALTMIMLAQATSIGGRMVAGYAASRIGATRPWILAGLASGVVTIAWSGVHTRAALFVYASLYGFFSGPLIPLPPSVFPLVCPDPKVLGARLGMAQGISAVASLIGSPIAGALTLVGPRSKSAGVDYLPLQLFGGVTMVLGACFVAVLRGLLIRRRGAPRTI